MRYLNITIALLLLASCSEERPDPSGKNYLDGDIIFQETLSAQGKALKAVTGSRYTHMGIIYKQKSRYFVLEAIEPVQITPLEKFIRRGKNGHYVIKRLVSRNSILTPEALKNMERTGRSFLGKHYDTQFLWSDSRIYCSELVWKVYRRGAGIEIGNLQRYRDFDLTNPTAKELIRKRFGSRGVPLDETVIPPSEMFNSKLLETVEEKN